MILKPRQMPNWCKDLWMAGADGADIYQRVQIPYIPSGKKPLSREVFARVLL